MKACKLLAATCGCFTLLLWTAAAKADETAAASGGQTYCVIDLSGGAAAESYPVSYLGAEPAGGWTNEYKTTKLVLRRVEAGSFIMGGGTTPESCRVTISQPFYVGVFEITQKQWELVMGSNPSKYEGDTRPVEQVSYDAIRGSSVGTNWPASSAVDATSFLGRLRARTGLDGFDLPTIAQWEYACRAGTTTEYNNGGSTTNDLNTLGRYRDNQSDGRGGYTNAHTAVGSYVSNSWGLYDMHGNVWEWCLDWCGEKAYGIDPVGPSSGSSREERGGGWDTFAPGWSICTSSSRDGVNPSVPHDNLGFRLVSNVSSATVLPSVAGDADATVTGDAKVGYTVTPSATNRNVEVTIPDGVSATKVTVVVGTDVATVRPNGANVVVKSYGYDITAFLDIPAAVGGVVNLASATVKAEYANEPLDVKKDAVIDLGDPSSPLLKTAPTREGLVYTLREGETLDAMQDGATKDGDGSPWTPAITVKGGASGFYTIRVDK